MQVIRKKLHFGY